MCNTCGCRDAEEFEAERKYGDEEFGLINLDNDHYLRMDNRNQRTFLDFLRNLKREYGLNLGGFMFVDAIGNQYEIIDRQYYAEEFGAENANKIHVLLKEEAVDNQYGKYDGEESFEMHISQSQEELRNKVKEYLNDLVSDGIDDYIETLDVEPDEYDVKEEEIRAKITSPETSISKLCDLLNEMSEALENSRGDYGARYSYYTPRDTVLRVSGINPDSMYMAEDFGAEIYDRQGNLRTVDDSFIEATMDKLQALHRLLKANRKQILATNNQDTKTRLRAERYQIQDVMARLRAFIEDPINHDGGDFMVRLGAEEFGAEGDYTQPRSRAINNILWELRDLDAEQMFYTILTYLPTKQANQLLNQLAKGLAEGEIPNPNMRLGAEGYDEIEVQMPVDVDINWKTDPHPHPNEDDIDEGEIFDEVEGLVESEVEGGSNSGYGDTEFEIDVEDDLDGEITQEIVKVEYDYDLQAESFQAKGIDTFSQPFEELNPLGAIGKLMVFAGSVIAGTAIGKKLGGQ